MLNPHIMHTWYIIFMIYTKQKLHKKIFTSKNFYTRRGFTPNSFYIRNLWYQRLFTPETFPTTGTLHRRAGIFLHQKTLTKKTQRNIFTAGTFCTKGVFTPEAIYTLHQRAFHTQRLLEQTNCTKRLFRRTTFTPKDVNARIVYIQKL